MVKFELFIWRGPSIVSGEQGTQHYELKRIPPKNCGIQPHGFTLAELHDEVEGMLRAVEVAEQLQKVRGG